MSTKFGLTQSKWTSLLRGMARGEYRLLLGAGAAADSRDKEDHRLPLGNELAAQICRDFRLDTDGEVLTLQRAYERVKNRSRRTVKNESIGEYFHRRFSGVRPPDWYADLLSINWNSIWTLNIDDSIETAFKAQVSPTRPIRSVTWMDRFAYPGLDTQNLPCIHLHGFAATAADGGYVFDLSEYLRAVTSINSWHAILRDEFYEQPFVVLGAKLTDEIDLQPILSQVSRSDRPSIVVLKALTSMQREELEDYGLVPVEADASSFITEVIRELPAFLAEFSTSLPKKALSTHAIKFVQQFEALVVSPTEKFDIHRDFYLGYEPMWVDIVRRRDARFEAVDKAESIISSHESVGDPWLVSLVGPPFTGKSTSLLRIARDLITLGLDPYFVKTSDKLDVFAIKYWIMNSPTAVLVIDDFADHAPEIGQLIKMCSQDGTRLRVIGCDRDSRQTQIVARLDTADLVVVKVGKLSDVNIDRLLSVLRASKRLGILANTSRSRQLSYFRDEHRRDLFSALESLERGRGFRERIATFARRISDPRLQESFYIASICHALGYTLSLSTVARVAGVSTAQLEAEVTSDQGALRDHLSLQSSRLHVASRRLASLIVLSALDESDRYRITVHLMKALAPFITTETIRQRTRPYRVVAEVMKNRMIRYWVGDRASDWFAELEEFYNWDSRYWEQRALSLSAEDRHEPAISYARYAVGLMDDSMARNTLATTIMRRAVSASKDGDIQLGRELYDEAVLHLDHAVRHGSWNNLYPYTTYFRYTISAARHGLFQRLEGKVAESWDNWMANARGVNSFQMLYLGRELDTANFEWMKLLSGESSEAREPFLDVDPSDAGDD